MLEFRREKRFVRTSFDLMGSYGDHEEEVRIYKDGKPVCWEGELRSFLNWTMSVLVNRDELENILMQCKAVG